MGNRSIRTPELIEFRGCTTAWHQVLAPLSLPTISSLDQIYIISNQMKRVAFQFFPLYARSDFKLIKLLFLFFFFLRTNGFICKKVLVTCNLIVE